MNIRIVSRAAARWVGAIILTLVAAHLVILVLMHGLGHDYARGFIPLFHLDRERNIPTFFSTALILANAGLIWLVSAIDAPLRWHWRVLAVVMAILSVDELVGFHERLAVTRGASIGEDAVLQYLWPVPYVLGALAVAVFMFPLLRGVGRETARLMVLAGLIYVGGAAGFEGWLSTISGEASLSYALASTAEETLEMSGMALLLYSVLDYLPRRYPSATVGFGTVDSRRAGPVSSQTS